MSPSTTTSILSVPDVAIKVNGAALPQRAWRDLLEVSVEEHVEGPSAFTLRLSTVEDNRLDLGLLDGALFNIGGEVEIQLGYSGTLSTLMYGDICGIDFDLGAGESPSFWVRGYDRRYRMRRGTRERSFAKMKDSDIATQIAQEHKLTPNVVDSRIQHESVAQRGLSDLDFLTQRATPIGYEVMLSGKTLHFRPRAHGEQPSLTLQAQRDLLDFSVRLSASDQPTEVVVRWWDPTRKEAIIGKASKRQETQMGSVGGPEAAHRAFGDAPLTITDQPVLKKEEAERIARERLERLALGYLQGDGRCVGRTDLRAGMTVDLQDVGKRFSGAYYVTTATHTYAPQQGYTTSFSARRNAT
jgi:phage protein D